MMNDSKNSARAARSNFNGGTPPFIIAGGEGVYLHTTTGRRILDGAGGAIVANIGYGRPEIAAAASEALTGGAYVLPIWPTEHRIDLVERILDGWLPSEFTRAFFVSGGSESVDTAMRIARQYQQAKGRPERWRVAGRSTSYHGSTIATLAVANHDRRRKPFGPLLADHPKIDALSADAAIKDLEAADPATLSAVLLEPVIGASGAALISEADYWPRIRAFCTKHDILLISDEVMTSFGRTGTKMGFEQVGPDQTSVVPDILVGGKGLGGGYAAIGAVMTQEFVVEPLHASGDNVMFFTFTGLEASVAIANCVLRILDEEALVDQARVMGSILRSRLEAEFSSHPNVGDIRGIGLMQGLELVKDRESGTTFDGQLSPLVVEELLNRDCWVYPAGSAGVPDGLLFGPAYIINESEIDDLVARTRLSLDAAVTRLGGATGRANA